MASTIAVFAIIERLIEVTKKKNPGVDIIKKPKAMKVKKCKKPKKLN